MSKKRDYANAFQSDLVTLHVGHDGEKFTVHEDVVTKARYFAGCFESTLQESHTNIIKLPGDEPAVISKVLEYLHSGKDEAVTFEAVIISEEKRLQFVLLATMYIAADKFCSRICARLKGPAISAVTRKFLEVRGRLSRSASKPSQLSFTFTYNISLNHIIFHPRLCHALS